MAGMETNPYESPSEVGYESPDDENERVKTYFVYFLAVIAACMVSVLFLSLLQAI